MEFYVPAMARVGSGHLKVVANFVGILQKFVVNFIFVVKLK